MCAINGLLYVIGGDDGSCNLSSVEYYNPATDKWSLLPMNMSNGRSYAGESCGRGYFSPAYSELLIVQQLVLLNGCVTYNET